MHIVEQIAREFADPEQHGVFWIEPPKTLPDSGKLAPRKSAYNWKREPAPQLLLERHIAREADTGIAVLLELEVDGQRYSRACVFDIDDHAGHGDGRAHETACRLAAALVDQSFRPMVVSSGGGYGFHVWLFFERAKRKDQLRALMTKMLASLNLREGKGGVHKGEVECFPSSGPALIALPFARASRPFELLDGALRLADDTPAEVPISADRKRGPKPQARREIDIEAAFAAFVKGKCGGEYDAWLRVGMATKSALGEQGYPLWAAWSAQQPGYGGEEELREKWDRALKALRTPPEAFWAAAKRAGYAGGFPDGIDIDKRRGEQVELLEIVRGLVVVRSSDGQAFAEIAPRVWANIRSRTVQREIVRRAYDEAGLLIGQDLIKTALSYAEASASERGDFHVRCARESGRVFFAVGDDEATVFELHPDGPRVCEDPPVRFKATDGLPAHVAEEGSIKDLEELVSLDRDNLDLLVACLIKWLIQPDTSHPLVVLAGPQGSAKSSTMETLVRALDPRRGLRAAPPASETDLVIAASSSYVVSFDNISTLNTLADPLCRLATGGGIRKRELYTDGDTFSLEVKRPVILSGIDPMASQQDLVSRMIRVDLSVPPRRVSETELERLRDVRLPRIRRFLLELGCRVLRGPLPRVDDPDLRLQDFAEVGEAVCVDLGRPRGWFTSFYKQKLSELVEEEAEGDIIVSAIVAHLGNGGEAAKLEGPCEMILRRLIAEIKDGRIAGNLSDLPRSNRALSARLKRAIPALNRMGIEVEKGYRVWTFRRRPAEYVDLDLREWTLRDGRGEYLVSKGGQAPPF